ncbi:GGDEF domain-containing protein, partial [Kineococcus glutinatus]|uniref:GGDEF domain-containing protein n=1 Tax=Kineococcus glutinatus TaxID=1070872 RepID=UPI0031E63B55
TDALTGLPNRRTADAELERLCARARAEGRPLSVAMIDLDRFKVFNDTFGHQAGDKLLQGAAEAWRSTLEERGVLLARYGGEEFQALALGLRAEQLQAVLEGARAGTPAGQTFSAGVAQWDGAEGVALLVGRADVALYAAKRAGRDRVHLAAAGTGSPRGAAGGRSLPQPV